MQPVIACPDADTLRQFAQGAASAADIETFAQHLGQCASCAEALDALDGQTDVAVALRAGAAAGPLDPAIEAMIDRLQRLASDTGPAGAYSTVSTAATPVPGEDDPSTMLAPPQGPGELGRLGGYRVLAVLGAGGMGMVFQAEDLTPRRPVALKVMRPALAASATARHRFLREAQSAASVRHDHIVTIHHAGEAGGVAFLAMELLEGESLEHRLGREAVLPIAETLRIGQQIADGLAAAHARGLIHRDIKPSNIWLEARSDRLQAVEGNDRLKAVTTSARVKLLDFGLARSADGDANLTQSGAVVGTPAYMAPEQADGGSVDARTDLFSLGCVLYRMVTGQAPFRGATHMQVMRAVAFDDPKPARQLNPKVSAELSALIDGLLAKDPAKRPASAREVADRLSAIDAAPPPVDTSATEELPPVTPPSRVIAARPRSRGRAMVAAAVALVVLLPLGYFYGGTVVRIATNKGELVIENADPNVEATIKGKTATIYDKVKDRRFVLSAGEYDVEVREEGDGGLRFATKRFTITRNGKETFEARLELAKQNPASDDRKAAEWVLSIGGLVRVDKQKQDGHLSALADLPRESFRLTTVYLDANRQVTDEGLGRFKDCKDLTSLSLADTKVTDAGLAHFKYSTRLALLNLHNTQAGDAGLANLKDCKNLVGLHLGGTKVSDAGLAHFKDCNLAQLALAHTPVTDLGLAYLKGCKNLVGLDLHDMKVSDAGLANFKGCKDLQSIGLRGTPITDKGLAPFHDCKKLTVLDLVQTKVTKAGIEELKKALPQCKIEWDGGTIAPQSDPDRKDCCTAAARGAGVLKGCSASRAAWSL